MSGEQEIVTKIVLERFGPYIYICIENFDQKMNCLYDSDEIEISLSFYRSFSAFWNIFGGLCTQVFIHQHVVSHE